MAQISPFFVDAEMIALYQDSPSSLQTVLAAALWFLGNPEQLQCQRRRSLLAHQLRFIVEHQDAEPALREVASCLHAQAVEVLGPSFGAQSRH